jgi:SAM-dependent methyltransferase
MSGTVYDRNVRMYLEFIDRSLASEPSLYLELCEIFRRLLGPRLDGARVLDVACGEGYTSRFLAPLGPREVVGVDLSTALIDVANERNDAANASFRVDDARMLSTIDDASMDVVVSQMAMMDIADHVAMFRSVRRVIAADGMFVFSLLHPCFQSPTNIPEGQEPFLRDSDGQPTAVLAWRYTSEGHFMSGGDGVRGHMGSYHRMLSTYVNDLQDNGFRVERLEEPVVDVPNVLSRVPIVMVVSARPCA